MTRFVYHGRDAAGQSVDGTLEAMSPALVADALLARGVTPVRIGREDDRPPTWRERLLGGTTVSPTDLALMTRQLHSLLHAGVPVIAALQALSRSTTHRGQKRLLAEVGSGLQEGHELSQALARRRDVFDGFYLAMVRVGETAGRLPEVFMALYRHLEFQRLMSDQVAAALRYPKFVVAAMAIALVVINVLVIPSFAQVFANAGVDLPLMTRVLLATSAFFVAHWLAMAGTTAAGWAAWRLWLRTDSGAMWWHRWQLRLPLAGRILRTTALARICQALQMTLASGVPIIQGLTLASEVADNRHLARRLARVREGVERGESLLVATSQARIFTPIVLQMIAIGEETGRVDELLGEIAQTYRLDVEMELKALSQRIEPILVVVLGAMVLVLALGVFMPMWDLGKAAIR